ncbi:MAG TPA: CHAT domain-containing protein [Thermoanaerobaculia bacterium]|jgi:tetratricopeptide (TPR) repeat protein|nr:CHAT domain-containing protein [Thermoanaerobaculia bacterium]
MLFISHASTDDAFVAELRQALEALNLTVWVDSRNLRGGSKLAPEIAAAIEQARHFLVVLSPSTVNSPWVRREIQKALAVEQSRKAEGYRVIPLLLPGITPGALGMWFAEEPVAVPIEVGPTGLSAAMPALLAAVGERLPTDPSSFVQTSPRPIEELILALADPKIETHEGKRRATATATLIYEPAQSGARRVESRRFAFTAPLGPIETADLRWYLETYSIWPDKMAQERAEGIANKLPQWGQELYQSALGKESARDALAAWQTATAHVSDTVERRFSVQVDRELSEGSPEEAQAAAGEAATELLALPWELLHDGRTWLFQGKHAVRVRRRLPNRHSQPARSTALPVRILLVSPRPEKNKGNRIGYIDHRVSARPLLEAVENLGSLARLSILQPPTYAALKKALEAGDEGQPFDVVHFDGHGVYDPQIGLGGLCFEDPNDEAKLEERRLDFVDAARLAGLVREHRIPLVFLEACQTAVAEVDPTASVAGRLLEEGVTSVVAMSYSVLVETARRFVQAFYSELAMGARVGRAMLAGQQALFADTWRGKDFGAGELRLQDWFVPVLYQEEQDPQLITRISPQEVQQLEAKKRRLSLGDLPAPPPHSFQGRSRELLALERLLHRERWAVVRGTGGQGKTTLAIELARWLTRTGRFARAAFVNLERHRDARAVLDTLGHQLLPEGDKKFSVAQFRDFDEAVLHVERALHGQPSILVIDNCESVLPERGEPIAPGSEDASSAIFALCWRLLDAPPRTTRLVFTTREPLPPPFAAGKCERELGALDRNDAIELVSEVMKQNGWTPPGDTGSTPQEVTDLVEAVNRHARALVLLAREVARRGVQATTGDLRSLMAGLEQKHPGDRENSLYASVELSLRRLSADSRVHVRALAVCQGGVHLEVLEMLTGLEPDAVRPLAIELIEVGLGENLGYGHLRLDPGLSPYLLGELAAGEADALRSRWAEAMAQLTGYLDQEQFKNARLARQLTLLELPNLLAMLDWLQARWPPEEVVDLAGRVEGLVANLGRPQALARATRVREQAAQKLGDWSHARYQSEDANIDRLLERGDLPAAHAATQQLLAKCLAAGEAAYPGAPYDIAIAHFKIGRVLKEGGAAEDALAPLAEAQHRFQELADAGDTSAQRMAAVAITEIGDCLSDLGRLDEAAKAYEERIRRAETMDDVRGRAVAKFQLGTVRLLQKRYKEALEIYAEARDAFDSLGEPLQVAKVWHQIGMVHEDAGQLEPAEQAYRQSLAIKVRENDPAGQASTLNQLSNLYDGMGRLEAAAAFSRQAAEAYVRLADLANEGRVRNNLADTLIKLHRYDEARQELQRAIECNRPYGHAAEPWKTWSNLANLERATGHAEAAQAARQQAIETYLAYRRAGGFSQSNQAQLFAQVAQAIQQSAVLEMQKQLNALLERAVPPHYLALIRQLQAILAGDRNPALAADPELHYGNAAELQLLLEALSR